MAAVSDAAPRGRFADRADTVESPLSAVCWSAILAGALVAAAASLVLVALGAGFGFAAVSPWGRNPSPTSFAVSSAVWLVVVQWLASAVGGYLTGRLRTRWVGVHTHEVFFRDTAHGLVTWALASVLVVGVLASAAGVLLTGGARAAAGEREAAATAATPQGYEVDALFRGMPAAVSMADARAETLRIFAHGLASGGVPAADRDYVAQLVAARAGISDSEARTRVEKALDRARQAADTARRDAAAVAIYTALSMLIGAFIACAAAALGGSLRDEHP